MTRSRRLRLAVAFALPLVILIVATSAATLSAQAAVGDELLPDLVTLTPSELRIATPKPKEKQLRLANTVANVGTGVLELTSAQEDCNGDGKSRNERAAFQRIFTDTDGNGSFSRGVDQLSRTVKRGCFDFHPQHHHWHFDNFSRYELTTLVGGSRGAVVAATDKVSFCIMDSYAAYPSLPGAPTARFFAACSRDGDQGLSIGWADIYGAQLQGQELPITGLPNGTYCLVSTADPGNQLIESDEGNNESAISVTITGTTVATGAAC